MPRQRLDVLLVERSLAGSREQARHLILAGQVWNGTRVVDKPGVLVDVAIPLQVRTPMPYVGRGGLKLAHALDRFHIDPEGLVCADIGASTGGFTDVLLQRGATKVYAIDVGSGQLDYRLRIDPRVVVLERVNARFPLSLPEPVDLATADVSFISLQMVLPSVFDAVRAGGAVVPLVKPQFEAGRSGVGKGGVVRDATVHRDVLHGMALWLLDRGIRIRGLVSSPVLGDKGNREFFFSLVKEGGA